MRLRSTLAGATALLALALASCGGDGGPRSVVLITLDTTRADALSCLGGPEGLTPNVDRMAAEGVLYTNARTTAPLTLPSHCSMLTGLYPPRHGVRDNGRAALPDAARTLAEAAQEAGVETGAFVGALVLDDAFGLGQGFDRFDAPAPDPSKPKLDGEQERPAGEVVDAALAWLAERDGPYLLWVHVYDPHAPYEAPRPYQREGRSTYHAEVAYVDRQVGRVLDALDLDSTYVAIVADHGEALGEHGEETHSVHVYRSVLRVPMILRDPDGHRAGERSDEVVSVVDVGPTLAEALGVELGAADGPLGALDGTSLYRARVPSGRGVYFESYYGWAAFGWSPLAGWADEHGKYLHAERPRLFDPSNDAAEERNLAEERRDDARRYRREIGFVADAPRLDASGGLDVGADVLAGIRGLGYLSVGAPIEAYPHPLDDDGRPSPLDREAELRALLDATYLSNVGRCGEARPLLEGIVAGNPDNWQALEYLGFCLLDAGEAALALPHLERLDAAGRATGGILRNLAACLEQLGRDGEAAAVRARIEGE